MVVKLPRPQSLIDYPAYPALPFFIFLLFLERGGLYHHQMVVLIWAGIPMRRFSSEELHRIRNYIPIRVVIEEILEIPGKDVEGVFRFVCPSCHESKTAVNPRTNLSRCFLCNKNFNTIDIFMADRQVSFVEAIKKLRIHMPPHAAAASGATAAGLRH